MMSKRQNIASSVGSGSRSRPSRRSGSRSISFGYAALFGAAALALGGCTNGGGGSGGSGGGTNTAGSGGGTTTTTTPPGGKSDKVDILFAIDNSRSMADKQQVLTLALGDLLSGLAAPPCLDANGQLVPVGGPGEACPAGSERQFQPVTDIHIGVISSSLGGHGSDACGSMGAGKQSNNDKGHLLDRVDPAAGGTVPTYQGKGFLAWDPTQQMSPPGEANAVALGTAFADLIVGAGQIGCGYESQLESVYRFLADPAPYAEISVDQGASIVKTGVDTALLDQRKAFLRPDSLLVVLSLSDENDCSTKEEGQFYFANQQKTGNGSPFHLPKARAVCATNPNDECCLSCGQMGPLDANGDPLCAADPSCKNANGQTLYLDEVSDNINVRCFHQKERFGIDFLYPTERYVNAFTQTTITDAAGNVVPNPIFSDLDLSDAVTTVRDPSMVLFAGIVGVPWQDIAKNPSDLKQGFKNATELAQQNANGVTTWDIVLGDPAANIPPADPFMIESITVRSGTNPVTGTPITAPGGALNPINGTDWTIPKHDDLQYACIMDIPDARDCSIPGNYPGCDCEDVNNDNPLCEAGVSGDPTSQVRAKAYPGLRQLGVLKGLGDQGVVGSICPSQTTDAAAPDYAYRPVIASLLDAAKDHLQ